MKQLQLISLMIIIALLNLASIRKSEDPVINTQTNPIAHQEKLEEIKEGEKGAPSPLFIHFQKEPFLIDPPMNHDQNEEDLLEPLTYVPSLSEEERVRNQEDEYGEDWLYQDAAEDFKLPSDPEEDGN